MKNEANLEEGSTSFAEEKTRKYLEPTSIRSIFAAAVLLLIAQTISAQISAGYKPIYPIKFKPGTNTAVVKGTIARKMTPMRQSDGAEKFTLPAQAGQSLKMGISSDNHQAVFTILQTSPAGVKNELVRLRQIRPPPRGRGATVKTTRYR